MTTPLDRATVACLHCAQLRALLDGLLPDHGLIHGYDRFPEVLCLIRTSKPWLGLGRYQIIELRGNDLLIIVTATQPVLSSYLPARSKANDPGLVNYLLAIPFSILSFTLPIASTCNPDPILVPRPRTVRSRNVPAQWYPNLSVSASFSSIAFSC
jgi:hypothetical protein